MSKVCPKCHGKGKVPGVSTWWDDNGDDHLVTCEECHGLPLGIKTWCSYSKWTARRWEGMINYDKMNFCAFCGGKLKKD